MLESELKILDSDRSLTTRLRREGYAVLSRQGLATMLGTDGHDLDAMHRFWSDLPPDQYLRDGGHYRYRRHSSYVMDVAARSVTLAPHRAHWQPVAYNALHGGIERWYQPLDAGLRDLPVWSALLLALGQRFAEIRPVPTWYIEAHQFRIDTSGGIGRPTPEGAHRDGVDFVSVSMLERAGVKGGETRVFEADGPRGLRFTMDLDWTTLLLDDERVIHETTPIQPLAAGGHRDTLVLTYRSGGFQGPSALTDSQPQQVQ